MLLHINPLNNRQTKHTHKNTIYCKTPHTKMTEKRQKI